MQQKTVIKPSLSAPGRVAVTTAAYNSDGRLVAAGLMDGTLQVQSSACCCVEGGRRWCLGAGGGRWLGSAAAVAPFETL